MITVRLPTVDSVSVESVQDEVIAKRTLLRAKSSNVDMRITIDERVKDIAIAMLFGFGSQMPKSKLYRFPKELSFSSISDWELVMKMKGLCFGISF